MRVPAEWEKQEYIMLVFPSPKSDWEHSIYYIQKSYVELIKAIIPYQKCVLLCEDKAKLSKIMPKSKNIKIVQIETNDTWIRDFGAISIYEDNKLKLLNFKFNAWGGKFDYKKDNLLNRKLQELNFFKNPMVDINFVLEGGSIDTNGKGTLLTTQNCIFNQNRNPKLSKAQILNVIKNTFGINEIIVLQNGSLIGDDTDSHIDTLARFIDKETIAYVKCYDTLDEHYITLKKMEDELKKTKFHLLALPLPSPKFFTNHRLPATYLNFVFINGALIVPTYKDKNDKIVLKILQDFFPTKDIIGVDASIFIRERGSLHCASMNYYPTLQTIRI
ncbi:MAG: agmatine deiminase family protein [Sulfurospirillum sp.]